MKTTPSSKGQTVLPAEYRRQDRASAAALANEGAIDWLLACPQNVTRNRADFLNVGVRIVDPFAG